MDRLLAADSSVSVLLLEAGPPASYVNGGRYQPDGWSAALPTQQLSSEPLTQFDVPGEYDTIAWHQELWKVPEASFTWQAQLLGGGGSVNGALTMRPSPSDTERLPSGWQAAVLHKQYARLEDELTITATPSADSRQYAAEAAHILARGWAARGLTAASLSTRPAGQRAGIYSRPAVSAVDGKRQSSATFHLTRAIARHGNRLTVRTASQVRRLLLMDGVAQGVRFAIADATAAAATSGGGGEARRSSEEVAWLRPGGRLVLTAGALTTPRLLVASGVGNPANLMTLAAAGVLAPDPDCGRCDDMSDAARWRRSSGVGASLSDHVMTRLRFWTPSPANGTNGTFNPAQYASNRPSLVDYFTRRVGPYAQYGPTGVAYLQSPWADEADMEIFVGPAVDEVDTVHGAGSGFHVYVMLMSPTSASSLTVVPDASLASGLRVVPTVYSELYLATQRDRDAMAWAVNRSIDAVLTGEPRSVLRNLASDVSMSDACPGAAPDGDCAPGERPSFASLHALGLSDDSVTNRLQGNHWAGTCALGVCVRTEDAGVHNTTNVHVADGSLLPHQLHAHPVLTVMAIASEVAAKLVAMPPATPAQPTPPPYPHVPPPPPQSPPPHLLIDADTPLTARSHAASDGSIWPLVYSDEFESDGRTFASGDDAVWEALDHHYWQTQDLETFVPSSVTTSAGRLRINMSSAPNGSVHPLRSGSLNSWNKFCFTGGRVEVKVVLPGNAHSLGFWPSVWLLGNLARAGYSGSTDGVWPYSYDTCDAGVRQSASFSRQPGQRINRCVNSAGAGSGLSRCPHSPRCICKFFSLRRMLHCVCYRCWPPAISGARGARD